MWNMGNREFKCLLGFAATELRADWEQRMSGDHDDTVRLHAYAIWQREGRLDGQHESHWKLALAELGLLDPTKIVSPKKKKRSAAEYRADPSVSD